MPELVSPVRLPSRPSDRRVSTAALRPGAVPGRKAGVLAANERGGGVGARRCSDIALMVSSGQGGGED